MWKKLRNGCFNLLDKILVHFVVFFQDCFHFFNADMFLDGASLVDMIPQSFRYPPDVHQIARMLSIENLHKAEMRSDPFISDSGK